ncbi:GNAT family N-acetyltransferase [Vibrio sp. DW001]|uniref:GNAT family N-acetyltransferase n=1 Tax=Vibrio sp. DW001 TaxID=2912315 RepID=UPI0023B08D0B|nr:GNAT family N-acetyltransferase [Vibrio sp. DW001]WED25637.1 GNAT family N-acetyltransferase [Vibrio sp. DW001]
MELTIGNTPDIISKAHSIRHQVFVVEQDIPQELDHDGLDNISSHALVTDDDSLVATARLTVNDIGHAVLARVAVIEQYRGSGVASKVVSALLSYAGQCGCVSIEMHAHEYLRRYYEKFGFTYVRNVEMVGEHQLIEMKVQLTPFDLERDG